MQLRKAKSKFFRIRKIVKKCHALPSGQISYEQERSSWIDRVRKNPNDKAAMKLWRKRIRKGLEPAIIRHLLFQPNFDFKTAFSRPIDCIERSSICLMICGADAFFSSLEGKTKGWLKTGSPFQLSIRSAIWLHLYDFILPAFLYYLGVSITFSLSKALRLKFRKRDSTRKALNSECWFWLPWVMLDKNGAFPFFDWEQSVLDLYLKESEWPGLSTRYFYLEFWLDWSGWWIVGVILLFTILCCSFLDSCSSFRKLETEFEGIIGWFDFGFLQEVLPRSVSHEFWESWPTFRQSVFHHIGAFGGGNSKNVQPFSKQKWSTLLLNQFDLSVVTCIGMNLHSPRFQSDYDRVHYILLTSGSPSYSRSYSTGHRYLKFQNGPSSLCWDEQVWRSTWIYRLLFFRCIPQGCFEVFTNP